LPAVAIEAEGAVAMARAHDSTLGGVDSNFIQVDGFSEASTCPQYAGLVILRVRGDKLGDRQTAIALAAQLASKKVRVSVDPAFAGPDGCWLRWINLMP
jgi:hypothetical protein